MRKTISILLTFIFFAVSCALPNNNINSQTKDNLKSEIKGKAYFYKDSKTKDYIKPLMTFKTSDEECQGGVLTSMAVLSGIPSNCNDKLDFYIKGQLANTIIAEQAGNYSTSFCLDCGVYDFEIRTTIIDNGSGLCNSSLKNQTFILPGGYHTEHIPCDRPEEDEEPECEGESSIIEPSALKSTFNIKAYSSSDIQSSVEEYLAKVEEVKLLQAKYNNLDTRGDTTKATEIDTKLQSAITQRDNIKTELINGLTAYKDSLRSKVNTLLNDTNYSQDSTYVPTDLQDYKDEIYYFENNIESQLSLGNTYNLIESKSFLADKVKLLIDLINEYSTGITDAPVINQPFDELDTITKANQVIIYLSKNIGKYQIKFETEVVKLSKDISTLKFLEKDLIEVDTKNETLLLNLQSEITKRENGIFELPSFSIQSLPFSIKQVTSNEWKEKMEPLLDQHEKLAQDRIELINDILDAINDLTGSSIPKLKSLYDRLAENSEKNHHLLKKIQNAANRMCNPCLVENLTGSAKIPKYLPKQFLPQKQAEHVFDSPQFKVRISTGKDTGYFANWTDAVFYTQDTWNNGTTVVNDNQREVREFTYPNGVGFGTSGTPVGTVRVEVRKSNGKMHGYPKG